MVAPTSIVPVAGLTSTVATGTAFTVTAELPLFPSLVAVMVTGPPAALPVTRPFASTVARVALLVPHVTVRPVSVLPFASFSVAVSCSVMPTATLAGAGVTATESTGAGVIVTADVPLFASLVAVMVTGPPAALAVTTPFTSTVAMVASLVVHVTVRPVSGLPAASFGVAVSWRVVPVKILAVVGLTSTEATAILVWHAVDPVSVNVAPATGTNCH